MLSLGLDPFSDLRDDAVVEVGLELGNSVASGGRARIAKEATEPTAESHAAGDIGPDPEPFRMVVTQGHESRGLHAAHEARRVGLKRRVVEHGEHVVHGRRDLVDEGGVRLHVVAI